MAGIKGKSGGSREGSGRKSKAVEMGLQEKLDPMENDFLKSFHRAIKEGHPVALKLFADYRYGKPADSLDVTSGGKVIESVNHIVTFRDYSDDGDKPGIQPGL